MHGVYLAGKTCASSNFTSMSRRPAAAASSESCDKPARPGRRRLPLTPCWRRQQITHQPAQQSRGVAHLQHCRPFRSATAVSGNAVPCRHRRAAARKNEILGKIAFFFRKAFFFSPSHPTSCPGQLPNALFRSKKAFLEMHALEGGLASIFSVPLRKCQHQISNRLFF